jgi:hypothetical protein
MSSGGGGGWMGGAISAIGAGFGTRGYNRQADNMNRYYERMYTPSNINSYAQQYNPWSWDAIAGKYGNTGTQFQQDMYKIAQGQDISPWLLNNPLNQLNQGSNQNLARMQSIIGRTGGQGGLANAYALANLAGNNTSKANLMNNYGQWREQQRRSDLNWLLGQVQDSQNRGLQNVNSIAGSHQFKKNWMERMAIGLGAYGAGSGGGESANPVPNAPYSMPNVGGYSFAGNSPGQNSYVGSMGSQGNWYNPSNSMGGFNTNPNNAYGGSGSMSSIQTGSTPNWYNNGNNYVNSFIPRN